MSRLPQPLGIASQKTGPVASGPLAVVLASEIVKQCEEVLKQKGVAKSLGQKSTRLANVLEEWSERSESIETQERTDEVILVLEKTLEKIRVWRARGLVTRWLRRAKLKKDLEICDRNLDNVIMSFEVLLFFTVWSRTYAHACLMKLRKQVADQREREDAHSKESHQFDTNRELLLEILKEHETLVPPSPSTPNKQAVAQQYRDMQQGPAMLHRMTTILPPGKVLDGSVRKLDDIPVAGGSFSDIWHGVWLEEEKVALKGLRNVKVDNRVAQRRFVREIEVWSKLSNNHILQFYGIVTDLGANIYMVSPWLENGDVLEYTKKNPEANRLDLIRGAAEGTSYLHSENVIHGNLKCSKILVTASGEACIRDFGLTQVMEDINTASASTLSMAGGARWVAPEIIDGSAPSKWSDTYSFGMTILELLSGKPPFSECRREAAVILAVVDGVQPKRPTKPTVWLTDELWALMQLCWSRDPDSRPTMEEVVVELGKM